MTDAMKRALEWLNKRGGSGVLDRHGWLVAAGEAATQFAPETWLRLVADGLVQGRDGRLSAPPVLVKSKGAMDAVSETSTDKAPRSGDGGPDAVLIERIAQALHDHDDEPWTWPEHADDDGFRGTRSYARITPLDVQMRYRDRAFVALMASR